MLTFPSDKTEFIAIDAVSWSKLTRVFYPHDFDDVPKNILDNAIDLGNYVHAWLEHYIADPTNFDINDVEGELEQASVLNGIDVINDLLANGYELYPEVMFHDEERGLKGIIDVMGIKDDHVVLIDWKTSSSVSTTNKLQIGAYMLCIRSEYPNVEARLEYLKPKNHKTYIATNQDVFDANEFIHLWNTMKRRKAIPKHAK